MVEASPVKFYFAKYFFLAFSFLQWAVTGTIFFQYAFGPKSFFAALVFFTLGMISFTAYLLITDRVRRVAIGKNKIIVTEGDRNIRFEWPEVKSLKIIPYLIPSSFFRFSTMSPILEVSFDIKPKAGSIFCEGKK